MSLSDPALFYFVDENLVCGFTALHVEDIIWAGNSNFEEAVLNKLRTTLLIGKENNIPFRYLGLDISSTNPNEVTLSQYLYVWDLNVENELYLPKRRYVQLLVNYYGCLAKLAQM